MVFRLENARSRIKKPPTGAGGYCIRLPEAYTSRCEDEVSIDYHIPKTFQVRRDRSSTAAISRGLCQALDSKKRWFSPKKGTGALSGEQVEPAGIRDPSTCLWDYHAWKRL